LREIACLAEIQHDYKTKSNGQKKTKIQSSKTKSL